MLTKEKHNAIFLDVSKASDAVSHDIYIKNFYVYKDKKVELDGISQEFILVIVINNL